MWTTCLLGPQALHRTNWNGIFSTTGTNKMTPLHIAPATPILQQEKCFRYPPDCMSRVTESPNCVAGKRYNPFETPFKINSPIHWNYRKKLTQKRHQQNHVLEISAILKYVMSGTQGMFFECTVWALRVFHEWKCAQNKSVTVEGKGDVVQMIS